jgi:hypothetical protein
MQLGQLHEGTPQGAALQRLGADPRYKIYVEVGTWNGLGSTRSLLLGFRTRPPGPDPPRLWSVEADPAMHAAAVANNAAEPALRLVHGKLSSAMMSAEEMRAHPAYKAECEQWHALETRVFGAARLVAPEELPPRIDVAIIDGGEFCGRGDWEVLRPLGPRAVFMDDVTTFKCSELFERLHADPDWTLAQRGANWALFERSTVLAHFN